MALMSVEEWRKRKAQQGTTSAPATSASSSGSSSSEGSSGGSSRLMSVAEWRAKRAQSSVEGWAESANALLRDTQRYFDSWHIRDDEDEEYNSLKERSNTILAQADSWRKQYAGNDEAISYIDEVVSALSNANQSHGNYFNYYAQWNSEEDYKKWLQYSTPEGRQAQYEQNVARLEELQNQRRESRSTVQPGSSAYLTGESMTAGSPYGAALQNQQVVSDIDREIARLEKEIRLYKYGETDENDFYYGFKTADDYGEYLQDSQFVAASENREFQNAGRSELDAYDAAQTEGSTALSNGGYIDEEGNVRDARGNIVQSASAPEVQDKLGLFLSASEDDITEAYSILSASHGNYETTWADIMQEGDVKRWKFLKEDELSIYYGLLNTEGQEAAYRYLDAMEVELGRRELNQIKTYIDETSGLEQIMLNAASVPMNMIGGIAATFDNAVRLVQGEDINPYSRAQTFLATGNYIRQNTAEEIDAATKGFEIPGLGFSLGDVYQSGMSIADTFFGGKIGGKAYQAMMSMSAASSEMTRLYSQGASTEQMVLAGVAAGAAEWIFEKYSIENLISLKSPETRRQFFKNALIQGGIEMSEEAATELANIISNGMIMQTESDWAKLLEETGGDYGKALTEMAIQIANAGLGGFLSGFGSGLIKQGMQYRAQRQENKNIGSYISGANSTDDLMSLALDMASGASGRTQKNLRSQSQRIMDDNFLTKGGKNQAIGRLYNTVNTVVTEQNISEISTALQEKGFSKKDAASIAGAVAVQASGMELTEKQKKTLQKFEGDETVQSVLNEVLGNEESGINQRAKSIVKFEFGAMRNHFASKMEKALAGQENASEVDRVDAQKENGTEGSYEVSAEGKTILKSTGEIVSIQGIADVKDGRMILRLEDGRTVDASEVSYASKDEALIYETVAQMGASVNAANILVKGFKSAKGLSASAYARGIEEAFLYGKRNDRSGLEKSEFASKLNPGQQEYAYRQGQKVAGKQVAKKQATVQKAVQAAKESLDASTESRSYKASLEEGISESDLNESQKVSYHLAGQVAEAAKVNIRVYVGKTGEWGYYNHNTDEIYLNLNSTNKSRKSMMAFTLGHELVHRAKKGSPAKYKAFANFLVEEYGKNDASLEEYGKKGSLVDAMIAEQMDAAKEHGIEMTPDEAFEEVVCDACQRMLLDTDAGKKLAEFGAQSKQNKSFLEELKQWITEFLDKLRSIFEGVDNDSMAAKEFNKFDAGVKQILADMFVDMTIDAGENLSTIQNAFGKGTVVETNEHGEFTMASSQDGSQKVFNLTTWKNGGRETLEATLLREGYTEDEVKAALTIMDEKQRLVQNIANELNDNGKLAFPEQGRINEATLTTDLKDGHSVLSALVSNGDYPVNIDLLMVCKKRKAYQRVINRLCETGMIQQATVDALAIAEINKILGKYGFETACLGCFVESRRLRIQEWAQTICKEWNTEVKKRNPNAKAFGFGKGEATLTPEEVMKIIGELESGGPKNDKGNLNLGQGSAVKRMGVLLDKVPSLRRTLSIEDLITPDGLSSLRSFDSNLFSMVKSRYGSNSPKFVQEFNPYNHELAMYGKVPSEYKSLREYLYAIGGARMQSFSDFIVENWFDYCQIVADLAARKLPMHTYTKEISLAKLFGLTGIKINMSLIPDIDRSLGKEFAGLTRNEKGELELIWADKDRFKKTGGKSYMQSINFADAIALQNDPRYSANIGTIAVGVSDKHIQMMLDDARIRMVIPYHSSGMNPIFADLMGTSYYKDYTDFQNTKVKQLYNSKGQPVSVKLEKAQNDKLVSGFHFNAVLQELGDARSAAEAYKEWCADASKHTITIKGETYTAELTPKFDDFSWHDNYYKLLEDFNTYDCISEQAAPQGDVQQIYPEDFDDILKAELKAQEGHRQKQEANQAFDKAMGEIENYLKNHTKADTVHYAQQHGIKLSKKDSKLDAADKAKLKKLQEEGASFKLPKKITMSMTDSERTEILKDKVITTEVYEGQADQTIEAEKENLKSHRDNLIKSALLKIGEEFDVFTDYSIADVDIDIRLSKGNLKESISKKIDPIQIAKLLPTLKTAVENAVGIECHANRYFYDNDTVMFENLIGGYIEGDYFIPVRFGLKHSITGRATLYLIVDQQKVDTKKIKAEVSKATAMQNARPNTSRSAFNISVASVVPFVNGKDLLRYLPDNMLTPDQKKAKWEGIAETILYTNNKNDRHYTDHIRSGNISAAKQMVHQAAKTAGYVIKAFHQTGAVFTEFSTDNPVAGKNDSETPNGIFFKTNDHDIGLGGGIQMAVYLKADNMLHFADRKEANAWYCENVPGYEALQQELDNALKPYLDQIDAITEQEWDENKSDEEIDALFEEEDQVIKAMGKVEDSYRAKLRKLLDKYFLTGKSGYDGIELDYDGHRWVNGKREDVHTYIVFNPEQAKSADVITYDDNGDIIPISQRFDSEKKDIRYKLPVGEDTSPRALLSNAFETVITNPIEKSKLEEYKGNIDLINAEERKLQELREQIKELSFAKGPKDTKKIRELQFEATQTANRINTYDKILLRMEASKPLQNVLNREKEMVRKREKQKHQEALEAYRERAAKTQRELLKRYEESRKKGIDSRQRTAMRHKVKDVVNELNQYLLKGTKDRHVPIGLQKAVAEALNAVNMDTIGAEERIAKLQKDLMKAKTPEAIQEISKKIDHIREMGDRMDERLKKLKEAYDEFINSDDPLIANSHDDGMSAHMMKLIVRVGDTPLREMTVDQLQDVYDVYKVVLATIRNANKAFKDNKNRAISTIASQVMAEIDNLGVKKGKSILGFDWVDRFGWDNLKPVYAMEHIGSRGLIEAFNNVRAGEDIWAKDIVEAREFYLEKFKKYKYDSWDFEKKYKFTSTTGKDFELTLDQIMSLYAYSKRDQAEDHLRYGGIVFDPKTEVVEKTKSGIKVKYNVANATAYNISADTLAEIISILKDEQTDFVDEMQAYLSDVMGAKGNEVSLAMYDVKLFREKHYFPLKSAPQYMAKAKEQAMGEVKIKNSGFSKETKPHAKNPIVLSSFMDVWTNHVNDMSMYHAFVLPMEDFYRIYNYSTPSKAENMPTEGVTAYIENAYGSSATGYIEQMLKDLNGGARTDSRTGFINKMMGMFKKGAVFASASVVVQQPSAIARAAALIDIKHFIGPKVDAKRHKLLWNEVKQYAPVAIIKEMGYFDTNMGKSTQDFIQGKEYSGIKEKAKAMVTDSNYRDEVLSKAPALADELAWCSIWEAVKRETKERNPKMDVRSEEFLKLAGERFTEVIVKTQVYDSVLARSANMRSKDTGMKMATAFMAEPTTSINMIGDALLKGKRGNRKYCRKAIGSVIASVILNSFLVAWVQAARDDDEEESYLEKYIGSFTAEMLEGLNPLTYIPFIKDIVSIVQGYDVERSDMSVISDFVNAFRKLSKEDVSAWKKVEDFVGSICQFLGLPVKNIMRDTRAVWQAFNTIVNGEKTTARGIGYAVKGAITGKSVSNPDQLYESRLAGDEAHAARVESRYDDEDSANAAVRQAIKEKFMAGEIDTMTALRQMVLYTGMDASEAHWLMDAWEYRKAMGTDEGYSKYNDFFEAVQTGRNLKAVIKEYTDNGVKKDTLASMITNHFKPEYIEMSASERASIKGYLLNALEQCGVDREDAEERLADWDFEAKHGFSYSDRKEAYLNGEVSVSELRTVLIETGGYTEEDADLQIESYDWAAQGYEGATLAAVREYNEHCVAENVPKDVYLYIRSFSNNTENDVDEVTGKTIYYSAMKKVIAEIDAQTGLTPAQKTAIARSLGWSEKNINKYKTW